MQRYAWVCCLVLLAACSRSEKPAGGAGADGFETLKLRYQVMAGQVQPAELAASLGYLAPLELNDVGSTISGPQSVQAVVTGDSDFGGAFNGAVLNLMAGRAPIRALIGYYGVDELRLTSFFTLNGSPIKSARDLIGKKIAVNTLGAHSEFVIKEYMLRGGLTTEDVRQVTLIVLPPVNTELALREGQVDVAALYDIFRDRALERGGLTTLFTDYDLFGELTAGTYVLRNDFVRDNQKATRHFIGAVARAIEWARQTPRDEVIARFEKIVAERGTNEDAAVLKYWKSFGVAGKGGGIADREFQIWIDWMIKDGSLKPSQLSREQVYDNGFNPFATEAAAAATPQR